MLNLVLGYKSREKDATAEVLYLGHDGNAARDALNDPPEGVLRTMLSYPQPYKNRFFNSPEEAVRAVEAKAKAEAAAKKAEADNEAEPDKSDKSETKKPSKKSSQ